MLVYEEGSNCQHSGVRARSDPSQTTRHTRATRYAELRASMTMCAMEMRVPRLVRGLRITGAKSGAACPDVVEQRA